MTTSVSPAHVPFSPSRGAAKPRKSCLSSLSSRGRYASAPAFSGEDWTRLHLSLGVCAKRAQQWLEDAEPALRERYQQALREQVAPNAFGDYPLLHDPLEDDPQWRDAFEEIEEVLAFELAEAQDGPGFCLLLWNRKARLLREEFGLEWFSPAQMNPFVRFA